jgi:hypothetical protein
MNEVTLGTAVLAALLARSLYRAAIYLHRARSRGAFPTGSSFICP